MGNMHAIILAAGKGERLRGIVDIVPKPMVRIDGKPILHHNLEWLKRHDINDIYINLHHLPEVITGYFGDGTKFGVTITYSYEEHLLGTAGAVRKIASSLWRRSTYDRGRPFLVIYGDNRLDYNLWDMLAFHETHKGIGTIAFHRLADVSQSGIAVLDGDGRIARFIEKPMPDEQVSNLVNTGLYVLERDILEYIPPGRHVDFGLQVFPQVLRSGRALYGIEPRGTLTAIDTPQLFRAASPDL
jgi:mannose-1-phosphate guanylyltransferase/phosphomannomutase